MSSSHALISTQELAACLNDAQVVILDATYFVPPDPRDARKIFENNHLPGALFFDIDAIADRTTSLPHMLPPVKQFAEQVGDLGISETHDIIIYDQHGIMSAPRAWWMFKTFGHKSVRVLDGGLPKWQRENLPLESGKTSRSGITYHASLQADWVTQKTDICRQLDTAPESLQLLDARPKARFEGTQPEPREGLRQGHIPHSKSLPWQELIDPEQKTMKPLAVLKEILQTRLLDNKTKIICTCGSGVTACVDALALYLCGYRSISVYDGSWAEWGSDSSLPIEVSP